MKKLHILVAFVFSMLSPATANASEWDFHLNSRMSVIMSHVAIIGTGDVMVLGDSITEMYRWTENAGCQVLNAGFGGAAIEHLVPLAETLAATALPKIVHIQIGTNNVGNTSPTALAAMTANLTAIVTSFKSRGAKVVLWYIPPFYSSFGTNAARDAVNSAIQSVAVAQAVDLEWWFWLQFTSGGGQSGFAVPGTMSDGVHPTGAVQAARYARLDVWKNYLFTTAGVVCPP